MPDTNRLLVLTKPETSAKFHRRMLCVDNERWAKLKSKAKKEGKSLSSIVRELIDTLEKEDI